ncbi:MAG: hypothetical protein J5876_05345 [Lachnospiraceae bacterium]|nr:hypothetical protein [Lachnospiraceae bacterium]
MRHNSNEEYQCEPKSMNVKKVKLGPDEKRMLDIYNESCKRRLDYLDSIRARAAFFDKRICISNIRYLLKLNTEVKIGRIESEAGVGLGYMSRLEKTGNTADPSVEFVVTAAKLLGVSLDLLVGVDLTGVTATELYLSSFFVKLISDTSNGDLQWTSCKNMAISGIESIIRKTLDDGGYKNLVACKIWRTELPDGTLLAFLRALNTDSFNGDKELKQMYIYKEATEYEALYDSDKYNAFNNLAEDLYGTIERCGNIPKIKEGLKKSIDAYMNTSIE